MRRNRWVFVWSLVVLSGGVGWSSLETVPERATPPTPATQASRTAPSQPGVRLPASFERNDGQVDARVRYLTRTRRYTLFLLDDGAVVRPQGSPHSLRIVVAGVTATARPDPCEPLAAKSHYLRGSDPTKWVRDVPHCAEVRYRDVLPGIDQAWRTQNGRAEFRFEVRPGADTHALSIAYTGSKTLRIDGGRLFARLEDGEIVQSAPIAYQLDGDVRVPVTAHYALEGADRVRIVLGAYDAERELVIDPEIEAATYYGGSDREGVSAVAVDGTGACYFTGSTQSADLPTTAGAVMPTWSNSEEDAFVAKLTSDLSALVYATYLGGDDDYGDEEEGLAIAVDGAGNACVAGYTYSSDFPQVSPVQPAWSGNLDGFVAQLDSTGSNLLFSSYLGGSGSEEARAVAVDAAGNLYVGGDTTSNDFPLAGPYQATRTGFGSDGFVTQIRSGALVFSTYLGGASNDEVRGIGVDASSTATGGTAVVVTGITQSTDFPTANALQGALAGETNGSDAFVTRLAAGGATLEYSTYLGGAGFDSALAVAVDAAGNAYVGGETRSADFPVFEAFQATQGSEPDAFVSKLSAAGALSYSTYFGGDGAEEFHDIAVGPGGEAWVIGTTRSSDLPLVDPLQSSLSGDPSLFVSALAPDGASLQFSTYFGGSWQWFGGNAIAVAPDGAAFAAGNAQEGFPTTPGSFQTAVTMGDFYTCFVVKFAAPGGNTPPPNTIRSFTLPKKLLVRVPGPGGEGARKAGVKLSALFDTGPNEVDLTDPATLTLGPKTFDLPALTPMRNGRLFVYQGQDLLVRIWPSPIGSSKGRIAVRYKGDLGPGVELDGPFHINFKSDSGIDADGACKLFKGRFKFGFRAGELIAPELSIRKARARLPGIGKHTFRVVMGFTTDGPTPATAPDLHVAMGEVFSADIPASILTPKGNTFGLTSEVSGIKHVVLTYVKERIAVRGGDVDLGKVGLGPVPVLLIFEQGQDVRAVLVRMVNSAKVLKY